MKRCIALFDYEADGEGELSFKEGDVIIVAREDGQWWLGSVQGHETSKGWFPGSFVSLDSGDAVNDNTQQKALQVAFPYSSQKPDELSLDAGERVFVHKESTDGYNDTNVI